MAIQLFVNVSASSLSSALVRGVSDLQPIGLGELVVGDGKEYELFFVDGKGGYAPWSGNGAYIPYIAIGKCGYPSGGTFTATFGANTTAALAYNISPAALQTALQALASIGANNVSVVGVAGQYYVITFIGALAGTNVSEIVCNFANLTPASTIDVSTIVVGGAGVNEVQLLSFATNPITFADDWTLITNGWTGQLSIRTLEIIEAFTAAGGSLDEIFQITVGDPLGVRTTWLKIACSIQCTVINPESFAGADKPLLATQAALNAAVLGQNNFTYQSAATSAAGNTNISPAATSRHHFAEVTVTGVASTRTLSIITSNSPVSGDVVFTRVIPDGTAGVVIEWRNATAGGTLITTVTTRADTEDFFVILKWNGTAWTLGFASFKYLSKVGNLAGLADLLDSKANLKALFGTQDTSQTADFTVSTDDDGKIFYISAVGGAILATLPSASTAGEGFMLALQKIDGAANVITTSPATITLSTAGQMVLLRSDGTNWTILINYNPGSTPVTATQVVLNRFDITELVGGSSFDLDGIATIGGATSAYTMVMLVISGAGQFWQLTPGTDAAVTNFIVRPADFNASTNPVVWKRVL